MKFSSTTSASPPKATRKTPPSSTNKTITQNWNWTPPLPYHLFPNHVETAASAVPPKRSEAEPPQEPAPNKTKPPPNPKPNNPPQPHVKPARAAPSAPTS